MKILTIVSVFFIVPSSVNAVDPHEILADSNLEKRARSISKELRCIKCQNQSIDDSNAELARDLRALVRERLAAGDTDTDVINYVVSRYGDFVLLNPPIKKETLVLWFGPAVIFVFGIISLILFFKRQNKYMQNKSKLHNSEDL